MQPVQIRRPLLKAMKNLGVNTKDIPENMIRRYVRNMSRMVQERINGWAEGFVYGSKDLKKMIKNFVDKHVGKYAERMLEELQQDVLIKP